MTLFRQLIVGISFLFFVLLAGVEAIYLANARAQLQEQLGSQAQVQELRMRHFLTKGWPGFMTGGAFMFLSS